jgi:hypothetical protein
MCAGFIFSSFYLGLVVLGIYSCISLESVIRSSCDIDLNAMGVC